MAYGKHSISRSLVYKEHKKFSDRLVSVKDAEKCGRPHDGISDDNVRRVKEIHNEDRPITLGQLCL